MKFLRFLLVVTTIGWAAPAFAQSNVIVNYRTGTGPGGTAQVSTANPLPVTGSFSAGGFAPNGNYISPLSVSNASSNVALPTGTGIAVYNVGANAAYCKLGISNAVTATTSDDYIPSNSAVGYAVGSNTYIACITASSTTTINVSGGAGLLTGFGGGGGSGGGGGAVFGPTAAGSAAANPPVLMGGTVDGTATGNVDNWKIASGIGYITGTVNQGTQGSSSSPWYIDTAPTGNLITALNQPVPGNASTNCSATGSQSGTQAAQSDQYGVLCNDVWLWGGIVLGAATNFGTSPGAVKVPGVNANSFFSTANAPTTPHICGSSATLHASTNSDLTIVPVSGSTTVYICDYEFEFTGVGAFYFESATTAASSGSTCSGSLTQIPGTGLWTGQASNPIGKGGSNAFYRGVKGPSSNGLCLHTTALSSTTLDVTVFYDQY